MELKFESKPHNGQNVAIVTGGVNLLANTGDGLDLLASVKYQTDCDRVVLQKEEICEEFFDLKTRIAGEVLQKFITYQMKLAIIGDFSGYSSKALRDFIRESNRGKDICFVANEQEALDFLTQA